MSHSTLTWLGVLTMCTLSSALSQTSSSEVHVRQTRSGEPHVRIADLKRSSCSPVFSPAEGGRTDGTAASCCSAPQELSHSVNARQHDEMARRFVHGTMSMWRQRLNLEDWEIGVVMARRSDLKPKTRGHIRWDKNKKSAVIWVMDAADYQLPIKEMLEDMEFTVVHELVHLQLASLPRSEASRSTEEHAVNSITAALLRLARQQ